MGGIRECVTEKGKENRSGERVVDELEFGTVPFCVFFLFFVFFLGGKGSDSKDYQFVRRRLLINTASTLLTKKRTILILTK